jgi:uncharacterized membrane protein YcaP (DUF421 family)
MIGAIISVPMQFYERGMLQGVILLFGLMLLYNGMNWLSFKKRRVESMIQGKANMLIKDNVIQLKEMTDAKISQQQLFAELRANKIVNLGQVKRVYLESCGLFSIYKEKDERPGLSILPPDDKEIFNKEIQLVSDIICCRNCGFPKPIKQKMITICKNCGSNLWMEAGKKLCREAKKNYIE